MDDLPATGSGGFTERNSEMNVEPWPKNKMDSINVVQRKWTS